MFPPLSRSLYTVVVFCAASVRHALVFERWNPQDQQTEVSPHLLLERHPSRPKVSSGG